MIKIIIVAPNPTLRAGLRALLSGRDTFIVVDDAPTLDGLTTLAPDTDLLIWALDSETLSTNARDLAGALLNEAADLSLLLLHNDPTQERELFAIEWQAWGVLPLDAAVEELTAAIYALGEGLTVGVPEMLEAIINGNEDDEDETEESKLVEPLTERETEVLELLAEGFANKQIAATLFISTHTVKFHISSLYGKLGASNRTEAVRRGIQLGLISI